MKNEKINKIAEVLVGELYKLAKEDLIRQMGAALEPVAKTRPTAASDKPVEVPTRRKRRRIRLLRKGVPTNTSQIAALGVGDKLPFPATKQSSFRACASRIGKIQRKRFQKDGAFLVRVA